MTVSYPAPDLPPGGWYSDEPEMETPAHADQQMALITTLRWHWRGRTDYFCGGNLTVYYSPRQNKSEDFRGPDFFVVQGVDGSKKRNSWMVWEEGGRYPDVIVELLSDSTAAMDRGEKKRIYQDIFRLPEYFLFDPHSYELAGYRLVGGRFEPIPPDANGLLPCTQLGLAFGVRGEDLRYFTPDGGLVETPEETALRMTERAAAAEAELAKLGVSNE